MAQFPNIEVVLEAEEVERKAGADADVSKAEAVCR